MNTWSPARCPDGLCLKWPVGLHKYSAWCCFTCSTLGLVLSCVPSGTNFHSPGRFIVLPKSNWDGVRPVAAFFRLRKLKSISGIFLSQCRWKVSWRHNRRPVFTFWFLSVGLVRGWYMVVVQSSVSHFLPAWSHCWLLNCGTLSETMDWGYPQRLKILFSSVSTIVPAVA